MNGRRIDMKLLKQFVLKKDTSVYERLLFILPIKWLQKTKMKAGDLLNVYEVNESTIKIVAEKNPFGQPENISRVGRPRKIED